MTTEIKPVNCACGRKAKVARLYSHWYAVNCSRMDCWHGPQRRKPFYAVKVWNKLMSKA